MTAIPGAALAVMRAAADDYRQHTPPNQATPAGIADHIAKDLTSYGYEIRPATGATATSPRGTCPACGREYALTHAGTLRGHNTPSRRTWCPGSRRPPAPPDTERLNGSHTAQQDAGSGNPRTTP